MTLIKTPTKVELEGRGVLTLRQSDYVTQGGEGAIYRKGDTIVKLYIDSKKMKNERMTDKIRLLARTFSHESIVAPQGIVKNNRGIALGYYMPYARGEPLSRIFTNDFRSREGFDNDDARTLVDRMYHLVQYTHDKSVLMVDANELNWLARLSKKNGPVPYALDVDSWAIGSWPAKVIMPSIRDWHSTKFGPLTDWYAWAVVTFQVFTGIHPFKGKLDGYKTGEMERRMKDNASVFIPDVRLNRAVREFTCIPGPLLDWYQETFTTANRTLPPLPSLSGAPTRGALKVMRTVVTKTGGLTYENIFEVVGDAVTSIWPCGVVRTALGALYTIENKLQIGVSTATKLAVVEHSDGWLLAEEKDGAWSFRFIMRNGRKSVALQNPLACKSVLRNENRLFAVTPTELIELQLLSFAKPILTTKNRWGIMGNATRWYKGVGIADVLGSTYIVSPFYADSVGFVKTPELDDVIVVQASAGRRYAEIVVIDTQGAYHVYGFSFDRAWQHYTVTMRDIDQPDLNIVILPKGVVARIEDDGELVVSVPSQGQQKIVNDKGLNTTMRLVHINDQVVYRKDGAVWSLRMR